MHLRNIDNDVFASKIDRSGCRIAHAALQIALNSMNHEPFNLNIQITMEIKIHTPAPHTEHTSSANGA